VLVVGPFGLVLKLRTFFFCPSLGGWLFIELPALVAGQGCFRVPPAAKRVRDLYFEKIRVFKAGLRLNTLAWNNGIGLWFYFVGF